MSKTRVLNIGIAPYEKIKEYTLAIARGELKPSGAHPKIWFTSIESMAQVLSTKNKMLLELIADEQPESLDELAKLSGRAKSNLSRTLHTMERYGLVQLKVGARGRVIPRVPFGRLRFDLRLGGG